MPGKRQLKLIRPGYLWPCLITVLIVAGALLFSRGHPPAHYLSLYDGAGGDILKQVEVELGDRVVLDYVHSSDGTPVKAVFSIEVDGLHLLEEEYSWYGAGLESGSGHDFAFNEDAVTVSGYDRVFHQLPLRVARTVSQELHLDGKTISLNQLAPGGSLVLIKVEENMAP